MNAPDSPKSDCHNQAQKKDTHVDSGDPPGAAVIRGHAALEVEGFAAFID